MKIGIKKIDNINYYSASDFCKYIRHSNAGHFTRQAGYKTKKIKTETNGGKQYKSFFTEKQLINAIERTKKLSKNEKIRFLSSLKLDSKLIKSSLEVEFFDKLKIILSMIDRNITYFNEYTTGKYRVDMFMPDFGLVIEYDGFYHMYDDKIKKKQREKYIIKYILENYRYEGIALNGIEFIYVSHKKEYEGIGEIINYLIGEGINPLHMNKERKDVIHTHKR